MHRKDSALSKAFSLKDNSCFGKVLRWMKGTARLPPSLDIKV
jgi:hypothetical protein